MTSEEINTALYKKMYAEQEEFRKWLMFQPPEIILKYSTLILYLFSFS